jgi:hypothetical protein
VAKVVPVREKKNIFHKVFGFMSSVKLAVLVILSLAFSLATATVLESLYDTATARFYVYNSTWFYGILAFLGCNILFSALSRLPWQKRLLPFLLAHLGILTLLTGSWVTSKYGLDGSIRVAEGESNAAVDIDEPILAFTENDKVTTIPVRWVPPGVAFRPFNTQDYGLPYDLLVKDFITHADAKFDFLPRPEKARTPGAPAQPALHIKLIGGAMRIEQDYWLWTGDPGWAAFSAGPSWLEFKQEGAPALPAQARPAHSPTVTFQMGKDGGLSYVAVSSSGERVTGSFAAGKFTGQSIDPHWRGGVRILVEQVVPDAWVNTTFKPSRTEYGEFAPPSAIHVVAGQGADAADVWMGLGTRAVLRASGHQVEIGYFRRRVLLPFAVHLNRFDVKYYEGSAKPASYSSDVNVVGGEQTTISMNHPLHQSGVTLYQASYEDAVPRPTISILAVNQDPGRPAKYGGSLLIVCGTILLFANKYRAKKKAPTTKST